MPWPPPGRGRWEPWPRRLSEPQPPSMRLPECVGSHDVLSALGYRLGALDSGSIPDMNSRAWRCRGVHGSLFFGRPLKRGL
jgi:hypothetical protein